jgi:hypothetical protein
MLTYDGEYTARTTLKAKLDTIGNSYSMQAMGATVSYLQPYTLLTMKGNY